MGKRYLVEGAKLWCLRGSQSSNLLVPVSHDPQMPFLFLALFDEGRQESRSYFCPVLREEAGDAIYRIKHLEEYEIRICEELAESLLDRGAVGMELGKCEI